MANLENLKASVQKSEEKVNKCKATIERHKKQLEKKIQKANKETGIDLTGKTEKELDSIRDQHRETDTYWTLCEVISKLDDIKGAEKKLKNAEGILENWKEKLKVKTNEQKFIENNTPKVIVDFLNDWKEKVYSYYIKQYNNYQNLKEKLYTARKEIAVEYVKSNKDLFIDYYVNGEVNMSLVERAIRYNKSGINTHLELNQIDDKNIQKRLSEYMDETLQEMLYIHKDEERIEWLDKQLETEKQAKLLDMIIRINGIVGEITDASHLKVSAKGNLDGYIIGTDGKAKIETIGAGGYNIQRYHFRTLVHKL